MGKKAKIGKQRRDKYYHLAKETGYRSRAAFKLIQLNRKFEFLQKSRVCIDLCAAPGGWMQVAHENMPVSSIVVGVDLYPIKQIPGCISIIGDITTDKCRTELGRELKTWKADIVLNDGAPNVGKNWLLDAYQQSTLTLSALKLATNFLRPGGWFVTKVFRSKDYTSLIHVFKQLFKKVHATKPHASRNESAEIFVVCEHYQPPHKLDHKLLDPKHVFAELDLEPRNKLNVYNPEKQKKAKALGYPDNDYTLYHKLSVKDFIAHESAVEALQDTSEIVIDDERMLQHPKTTEEVIECCKDIKVLGRKELRLLLNWWKILKEQFDKKKEESPTIEIKPEEQLKTQEEIEDMEDEQIVKDIEKLKEEELREHKRKRKKLNKERTKLHQKMNLNMVLKGDQGPTMECDDMFSLENIKTLEHLNQITDQSPDFVAESDDDSENEVKKPKVVRYEKDTSHLDGKSLFYKDEESELEFSEDDNSSDKSGLNLSDIENEENDVQPISKKVHFSDDDNPLLTDLDYRDKKSKKVAKAELWFDRDIFKTIEDNKSEDIDIDKMLEIYKKRGGKIIGDNDSENLKNGSQIKENDEKEIDSDSDSDSDYDSDYNVNEMIKPKTNAKQIGGKGGFEVVSNKQPITKKGKRNLTVEDLALGSLMIHSKKTRRDLIDGAWNRFAFNDEHLPDWFVEDESKHMKQEVPVPKDLVNDYKKRIEDINVRPKKVMEAKARKKQRALRKLQRAKKKVETVMDNVDISDREKAKQIKALYRKATKEPKKEVTYVVAKKHMAQKRASRPAGVKGRYRVVDPRLKKDMRAQKAKEKTKGRGKKTRSSKTPRSRPRTAPKGKKSR